MNLFTVFQKNDRLVTKSWRLYAHKVTFWIDAHHAERAQRIVIDTLKDMGFSERAIASCSPVKQEGVIAYDMAVGELFARECREAGYKMAQ